MNSETKSGRLFNRIRDDILALELVPGSGFRLPLLSEEYDAGVTPLRECFNRLTAERLARIEHNKGFRVAGICAADLLDLARSRSALAGALFARSIEQGDEAWEAKVIGCDHQLSEIPTVSVLDTHQQLDPRNRRHNAVHNSLIAGASAPCLRHYRNNIQDQIFIQNSLRALSETEPAFAARAANISASAMAIEPHEPLYRSVRDKIIRLAKSAFDKQVNLSIEAFKKMAALLPSKTAISSALGTLKEEIQI